MNGFRKTSAAALGAVLCVVGASVLQSPTASAQTEYGDRPVIVIPRGGGLAAFNKFGCITCHMADGRGGQNEGGYGADLRITKLSEQEVMQVISEGRAGKGMPAFKGIIDEETIGQLAKFIKEDLRLK